MGAMDEFASEENLARAWRWIRSNPEAGYKGYFRDLYAVYAIADTSLLVDLRDRIRREIYEPQHTTKLLIPKASGIQRPITLLTVEDQIAYQAFVNVVADRLLPRVAGRYNREVFGHQYAGKTSTWFYRKWTDGYRAFNAAARDSFDRGFRFTASFDLTACYDSLDHGVLKHFLESLGVKPDASREFIRWLSIWTAWPRGIYHNHGIPQGPISSGLLSEVVLQHFDANRGKEKSVRYFRYVDDIRLFAKTESSLRQMLVVLDCLSKEVGLFPQSSKISIHEVKDIEDEIKSVSNPNDPTLFDKSPNQEKLRRQIVELTPRFTIKHGTRFKFLLANATPHHALTNRLWRIYEAHPEYFPQVCRYLQRYNAFPASVAKRVLQEIKRQKLYPAITAAFVDSAYEHVPKAFQARFDALVLSLWQPTRTSPDLAVAVGRWLFKHGQFTAAKADYACQRVPHWWVRAKLALASAQSTLVMPKDLEHTLNGCLRDNVGLVSSSAAARLSSNSLTVRPPNRTVHRHGSLVLKELGVFKKASPRACGIVSSIDRMTTVPKHPAWRKFFGKHYRKAERQIVACRAYWDTDMTAWANAMDSFNDWLLHSLYKRDRSLGSTYNFGDLGGKLQHGARKSKYPRLQAWIESVHNQRYKSLLSHAVEKRTGKPTKHVKFSFQRSAKKLFAAAISELAQGF